MSKSKKKSKKTTIPLEALPDPVRRHLSYLNMTRLEDYLDWCRTQGFRASYLKTEHQMRFEQEHAQNVQADSRVQAARRARRPNQILRRIVAGERPANMPAELRSLYQRMNDRKLPRAQREFTLRLFAHLAKRCPDLVWERSGSGAGDGLYFDTLVHATGYYDRVVRDVETWQPRSHNAQRRVSSLVRHLFAMWDVPRFLDSAWLDGGRHAEQYREWFLHIGAGGSLRALDLPLDYTRKMAHHFMQAPADFSVPEALRWGQVHGLGGDARLVEAMRATRLCEEFEHDDFWVSVLRFFILNPMLDVAHFGPVCDYLYNQRFVSEEVVGPDGRVRREPPPQPGLTMRGRTPDGVLRQVEAWHHRLGKVRGAQGVTFVPSGILPFRSVEGLRNQAIWTIRELTSSKQLQVEGDRMKHCVASYTGSCKSGRSSIWTLETEDKDGVKKLLTIEVHNRARRIVQARGQANRAPSPQARTVMARWANAVSLTIANWV